MDRCSNNQKIFAEFATGYLAAGGCDFGHFKHAVLQINCIIHSYGRG